MDNKLTTVPDDAATRETNPKKLIQVFDFTTLGAFLDMLANFTVTCLQNFTISLR